MWSADSHNQPQSRWWLAPPDCRNLAVHWNAQIGDPLYNTPFSYLLSWRYAFKLSSPALSLITRHTHLESESLLLFHMQITLCRQLIGTIKTRKIELILMTNSISIVPLCYDWRLVWALIFRGYAPCILIG